MHYYTGEEWDKLTPEEKVGNRCINDVSLSEVFKDGSGFTLADSIISAYAGMKGITELGAKIELGLYIDKSNKGTLAHYFSVRVIPFLARCGPEEASKAMKDIDQYMERAKAANLKHGTMKRGLKIIMNKYA